MVRGQISEYLPPEHLLRAILICRIGEKMANAYIFEQLVA